MIICKHKQSNIDVDVDMEVSENGGGYTKIACV